MDSIITNHPNRGRCDSIFSDQPAQQKQDQHSATHKKSSELSTGKSEQDNEEVSRQ